MAANFRDPALWATIGQTLNQMAWAPVSQSADPSAPMLAYQQKQQEAQQKNTSMEWLRVNDQEAYQYALAGAPVTDALKFAMERKQQAAAPKNNWMSVGDGTLFNKDTRETITVGQPKAPERQVINGQIVERTQNGWQPVYTAPQDPKEASAAKLETTKTEMDTNKMYRGEEPVKQYQAVKSGFERVRASATQESGAGDLGVIFGYMKMLDPTSVVRETEQASVQNAAGVPEQIRGLYNRVWAGEKLTPEQRAEVLRAAEALYQETANTLGETNKYYSDFTTRSGINPGFIMQPEKFEPLKIGQSVPVTLPNGKTGTIKKVSD